MEVKIGEKLKITSNESINGKQGIINVKNMFINLIPLLICLLIFQKNIKIRFR